MTKLSILLALFVPLLGPLLVPRAVAADPLPKQVAALDRFLGSWKGSGTITIGKDKAKIDTTWTCQRVSGQWGLACAFHVTGIPGVAAYEESDLFGYDPGTNTYHWYAVTNAAETHDHVAAASDGKKLEFVYTGTQDGKPVKEVIALELDGKQLTGRAETFVGGASASVMQVAMRKP